MGDRVPVECIYLALYRHVLIDPGGRIVKLEGRIERAKPVQGFLLVILSFFGIDDIFDDCVALGLKVIPPIAIRTSKPGTSQGQ